MNMHYTSEVYGTSVTIFCLKSFQTCERFFYETQQNILRNLFPLYSMEVKDNCLVTSILHNIFFTGLEVHEGE